MRYKPLVSKIFLSFVVTIGWTLGCGGETPQESVMEESPLSEEELQQQRTRLAGAWKLDVEKTIKGMLPESLKDKDWEDVWDDQEDMSGTDTFMLALAQQIRLTAEQAHPYYYISEDGTKRAVGYDKDGTAVEEGEGRWRVIDGEKDAVSIRITGEEGEYEREFFFIDDDRRVYYKLIEDDQRDDLIIYWKWVEP